MVRQNIRQTIVRREISDYIPSAYVAEWVSADGHSLAERALQPFHRLSRDKEERVSYFNLSLLDESVIAARILVLRGGHEKASG